MTKNKPYILINALTPNEFNSLEKHLIEYKNDRQQKLLSALKSNSGSEINKTTIFRLVYGEEFKKEKDYLLRNDLRKLSKTIESFIREQILSKNTSIEYFKFLLQKNAHYLFEKEILVAIKQLKKTSDFTLYEHQTAYFEFIIRFKPRKEKDLQKYRLLFIHTINETPKEHTDVLCKMILLLAVLERIIWQYFGIHFTDLKTLINPDSLNGEERFTIEKAFSYQSFGKNRIVQLNKCISTLEVITNANFNKVKELNYLESQLGLEYYLLNEFEQSKAHYKIAYSNFSILDLSHKIQLIYNYASMLCAANEFKNVIKLIDKHRSLFSQTPYESNITLFSVMAHINTNQINNLRSQLPDITENITKDAQLYWRILECIILYYEESYDLALTNLVNIYNTSSYNKSTDKAYKEMSKIFQHFISALLLLDKNDKISKLEALKAQSDNFINSYTLGFGSNMLCSIWLNKEIKKALEKLK